jgi:hypothetical protein
MGNAFDKIAAWTAADEGSLAVYEGIGSDGEAGSPTTAPDAGTGGSTFSFGGKHYLYDADGNIIEDVTKQRTYIGGLVPTGTPSFKIPDSERSKAKFIPLKIKVPKSPGNNTRLRLKV